MKKLNSTNKKNFNTTLVAIRKERGLTQRQLAKITGISYRMIAHYETQAKSFPHHIIPILTKALRVSADELLGVKHLKQQLDPEHAKLWRRLKKAEHLSLKDRKALFDFLDALLVRSKSKK